MAAPMVTGALALIASQRPGLSSLELRQLLFNSAQAWPELQGLVQEGRFLNVAQMSTGSTPVDECPDDDSKFAPGICGCGVSEADLNANGTPDCLDPIVKDAVPTKARVRVKGRKLLVSMEERAGVEWYIEVVVSNGRQNGRRPTATSRYYVVSKAKTSLPKPPQGARVKIRYAFRVGSRSYEFSRWSRYRNIGVLP
jgi:hypothetical protein